MTTGDVGRGAGSSRQRQLDGRDGYAAMWSAVNALAQTWADLPLVQRFKAALPRNAPQRIAGIPGRLQEMEAANATVSAYPLRLTGTIRLFTDHIPGSAPEMQPAPQLWDAWRETAAQVEAAHKLTITWLRSQMPGYPDLPALYLAPGATLTTAEMPYQLTWTPGELLPGSRTHLLALIGQTLQSTPEEHRQLTDNTRALGLTLNGADEWARLATATVELTESGRADLRQARETVTRRLSADQVGVHSQLMIPRYNYRVTVLAEVLGTLHGSALEYSIAFEAANRLLETAASDVFGELAAYGPPAMLSEPHDIDLRPGSFQLVSFTNSSAARGFQGFLEMGQVLWFNDMLVSDAVRLIGVTTNISPMGATERWTGIVLPETSAAWPH